MKLKECEKCYYAGIKKCFLYDKKYEELEIEECIEGFIDPYEKEEIIDIEEVK